MEEETIRERLPRPSSLDLRGKQSVRATFRLSAGAIETISTVAVHLGIKQKSLFDHLMDDRKCLNFLAEGFRMSEFRPLKRVQKTYVLNRKTLSNLSEVAREYNVPRDALVEYSIRRLAPIVEDEKKRHASRQRFLNELKAYLAEGDRIFERMTKSLGRDDSACRHFEAALGAFRNSKQGIEKILEKGKPN